MKRSPNVLLIDNYDSFVYNLSHLLSSVGCRVEVRRNDEPFIDDIKAGKYDAVVIGPGPGSPDDTSYFGNCLKLIRDEASNGVPILGVCLGFQGIAYAFGAKLKRAKMPMHGKLSVLHMVNQDQLFQDVPSMSEVMRYHSIMVDASKPLPKEIVVLAEVDPESLSSKQNGREIMAIKHATLPIYGVQFHPESFATQAGEQIMRNFLKIAKQDV